MSAAQPAVQAAAPSRGWLFGPVPDLVLGCGLGSIAVTALLGGWPDALRGVIPGAALVLAFSLPHYGATLLRVYELAEDRQKYRLFAVHATWLLALVFAASLYSPLLGSVVLTVYLTWSPWHYTGQNYGIFLMMLGRRGVRFDAGTKRWIHASFILSYALAFLGTHTATGSGNYAPFAYEGTVFELIRLGIPHGLGTALLLAAGVGYVLTTGVAIASLARAGSGAALAPPLVLIATQSLWFSVPVGLRYWGVGGESEAVAGIYSAYGFLWIAAAHAIQYLWITSYYATSTRRPSPPMLFLGKAALAGFAVWTVPALLFAPGLLGRLPHESGLALMVAAVVNLHHFVLDGVVWKLRDGRVSRILLRSERADPADPIGPGGGRRWIPAFLYSLGAVCVVYGGYLLYEEQVGFQRALARGDTHRARQAIQRFAWLGREGPSHHIQLGRTLAAGGETAPAQREFERSIELHPTPEGWGSLARLHEQQGRWAAAADAYQEALALGNENAVTLYRAGIATLHAGQPERAVDLLERAQALEPDEPMISIFLERARGRASGDAGNGDPEP